MEQQKVESVHLVSQAGGSSLFFKRKVSGVDSDRLPSIRDSRRIQASQSKASSNLNGSNSLEPDKSKFHQSQADNNCSDDFVSHQPGISSSGKFDLGQYVYADQSVILDELRSTGKLRASGSSPDIKLDVRDS